MSSTQFIEFPCNECGRKLKVGSDNIGRQAKCPQCSAVQTVPNTSSSGPPEIQFGQPAPAANSPTSYAPIETAPPAADPNASTNFNSGDLAQPAAVTAFGQAPATPHAPSSFVPQPASTMPMSTMPMSTMPMSTPVHQARDTESKQLFDKLRGEISKIFVGQQEMVLGTLVALFSSGHVLIESVPGLGKTLFVRTLGRVLGCQFGRIQFTADLMPSDITGAPIFDMKTQEFRFRPGPVFAQMLLADEINRSPAKTHAALLEIMQEYRVTIDGTSHVLEKPFLVMATQNPIESEGTYNLPEAQLDRFMFKLRAEYPNEMEEQNILKLHSQQIDLNEHLEQLETVTNPAQIIAVTKQNANIRVDDRLLDYINKIVRLTRKWPQFHMGASPRAGIALTQASRTLAAFSGRDYAIPDDVVQVAIWALRHRVILTAEAEVEGQSVDELLTELIRSVEVPRL
ncbi:MAG: MoxR-like ATPase [Pirellulaceae bacterium]|jgi:MoxR-like ATPase